MSILDKTKKLSKHQNNIFVPKPIVMEQRFSFYMETIISNCDKYKTQKTSQFGLWHEL